MGIEYGNGTANEKQRRTARVYDIVNAGPRHRYTCNGKLVSNCTAKGGLQTQNFPRGDLKESHIEEVFEVIGNKSNWRDLEPFGEPMDVLSSTLRGFIKAPPGKKFVSADFANIEGRVVAWLSGEEQKLERFREFDILLYDDNGNVRRNDKGEKLHKGTDIYIGTAAGILNKKPEEVTKEERQSYGKVSELACLGPDTLVLTDKGYYPLIDVTTQHKVWDGVEFVAQEGPVCRGIRKVMFVDGVCITPDHKILVNDIWTRADEVGVEDAITFASLKTPKNYEKNDTPYPIRLPGEGFVYDLVNAGPRNRFTIKTNNGHLIVHNCGFGGSVGAYAMMAKTYNVNIPEPQAKSIVNGWRREHPEIMNYLYENARIVMQVIKTGEPAWSGKVYHYLEDIFLCTRLPSGRVLRYAYPRIEMVTTPWGSQQLGVTFMTMKKPQNAKKEVFVEDDDEIGDSKWIRIQASPGLFTENYTQAVARDIMVEAGLRIEKEFGYPIIMSVHDELVAEVDEDFGSLEEFERVMAQPPEWGLDIPIACEGWVGHRYKK